MKNYSKITPEGTKDFLFEESTAHSRIEKTLGELFLKRGYKKIDTPTLEFLDVFSRESAGMPAESLYSLTDTSGRLLVLRPDNTMPIARVTATRLRDVEAPIRLYYNQRVFRRNPHFTGFNDETSQCGIELLGASGIRADLEIIDLATSALDAAGASDYRIELGHAGFFSALADELNTDKETLEQIRYFIEKKNFAMLNELLDSLGQTRTTQALKLLPKLFGGAEVFSEARDIHLPDAARQSLNYLETVYNKIIRKVSDEKISIDLGLVHRNNYYTGIVFRGYIEGLGVTAVQGGRYDTLLGEFGRSMPATGFGVEIDAIANHMLKDASFEKSRPADVLIWGADGYELDALAQAEVLSRDGLVCENCVADSAEEAKKYAESAGIPTLKIIGEKENGA